MKKALKGTASFFCFALAIKFFVDSMVEAGNAYVQFGNWEYNYVASSVLSLAFAVALFLIGALVSNKSTI